MKFSEAEKYTLVISVLIHFIVIVSISVLFGFIGGEVEGEELNPMDFIGISVIAFILRPFGDMLHVYLKDFFDKKCNKDA